MLYAEFHPIQPHSTQSILIILVPITTTQSIPTSFWIPSQPNTQYIPNPYFNLNPRSILHLNPHPHSHPKPNPVSPHITPFNGIR